MPFAATILVFITIALSLIATVTLVWMMHAWLSPRSYEAIQAGETLPAQHSFSVIVPCRTEREEVMAETVRRLVNQSHPDFEVLISLGDDDLETISTARRVAASDPRVRLSINHDPVKNKPRQLNTALAECTKEIVGVMDAESLTEPGLLSRVDTSFSGDQVDVVQGAVQLVNLHSTWFSLRNCLEYRIWFRSRLHGHAERGFIPLGGNTVFIRRALLEEMGGWDGDCLTEDCELGVRLSARGKRTVCVYDPAIVTREETPDTTKSFIKQRTRWATGFMQVLSKGEWKRLPTLSDRVNAFWLLSVQYMAAFAGLVLPISIVTALLGHFPMPVALLTFLPLLPTTLTVAFELLVLHEFGADLGVRVRAWDYLWLVVCTPLYQFALIVASLRAVIRFAGGNFAWEKTQHIGAHLSNPAEVALQ